MRDETPTKTELYQKLAELEAENKQERGHHDYWKQKATGYETAMFLAARLEGRDWEPGHALMHIIDLKTTLERAEQAEAAHTEARKLLRDAGAALVERDRMLERWKFIGTHEYTLRRPKHIGGGPGVVDRSGWELDGLSEEYDRARAEKGSSILPASGHDVPAAFGTSKSYSNPRSDARAEDGSEK